VDFSFTLTRLVSRELVYEVVASAGRKEIRRNKLPARVMVYFVMTMALFYGDAYEEVMRKLAEGLDLPRCFPQTAVPGRCRLPGRRNRHPDSGEDPVSGADLPLGPLPQPTALQPALPKVARFG
jgi:Insertion element 4 transposase N-terminal